MRCNKILRLILGHNSSRHGSDSAGYCLCSLGVHSVYRFFNVVEQAPSNDITLSELSCATSEVSEVVFFLLGAMTIVEIVDAHQGFKLVTDNITTRNPRTLLWVVS